MATQNIDIRISASGASTVVVNLNSIGGAAGNANRQVDSLTRTLQRLGGILAIQKVLDWADAWAQASGKVAVFAENQKVANTVMNELFTVAQNARQPLEDIASLYGRLSLAGKELGGSEQQMIQFTESVAKALSVQGTSAAHARGSLLQLSQAMGEGIVRAQEYNSMIENMPLVLKIVAQNLDGAGGSTTKLRKIMLDGKLTSKEFFEALLRGQTQIDDLFRKTPITFGQSFIVLENALKRYTGELDKALGVSNKFYALIKFITTNLDTIGKLLLIVGTGFAVAFAPAAITAAAGAMLGLVAALGRAVVLLNANPFAVLAGALVAAYSLGDAVNIGVDNVTTLRDLMVTLGQLTESVFSTLGYAASGFFTDLVDFAQTAYQQMTSTTTESTTKWSDDYRAFYADSGAGLAGFLRAWAKTTDAIAGLITGLLIGVGRAFGGLPGMVQEVFNRAYNVIVGWIEKAINKSISLMNYVAERVGGVPIPQIIEMQMRDTDPKFFENWGASIMDSISAGFESQGGVMLKSVDEILTKAQANAKQRLGAIGTAPDLTQSGGTGASPVAGASAGASREAAKLEAELRKLLNTIKPSEGALLEMARGETILTRAMEAGKISASQRATLMTALSMHYKDIIDPLGKVRRALEQESELLRMTNLQRETERELRTTVQALRKAGIGLSEEEVSGLRNEIEVRNELARITRYQDSFYEQEIGKRQQFIEQLQALRNLMSGGDFSKLDAQSAMVKSEEAIYKGTSEAKQAAMAELGDYYAKIDALRAADLISEESAAQARINVQTEVLTKAGMTWQATLVAWSDSAQVIKEGMDNIYEGLLKNGEDAFVEFVKTGKLSFTSLIDHAIAEFARLQFKQLMGGLGGGGGSLFGDLLGIGMSAFGIPGGNLFTSGAQVTLGGGDLSGIPGLGGSLDLGMGSLYGQLPGFATGGDFKVGGSGGTDSQVVAFRATPNERVSIRTPTQGSAGEQGSSVTNNFYNNLSVGDGVSEQKVLVALEQNNAMLERKILQSSARQGRFSRD